MNQKQKTPVGRPAITPTLRVSTEMLDCVKSDPTYAVALIDIMYNNRSCNGNIYVIFDPIEVDLQIESIPLEG